MTPTIIPDVLESSASAIAEKVNLIQGFSDRFHIDIIDGLYADNLTIMPEAIKDINFNKLNLDLHLLTEEPIDYVASCATLKDAAGIRVIGQIEHMGSQIDFVTTTHSFRLVAGLALDLYTPLEALTKSVLDQVESILLMSVKAGYASQTFNALVLDKIHQLRGLGFQKDLIIDGGLNPDTVRLARAAGATSFAVNSFLWSHKDVKQAFEELHRAATSPAPTTD